MRCGIDVQPCGANNVARMKRHRIVSPGFHSLEWLVAVAGACATTFCGERASRVCCANKVLGREG